MVKAMQLFENTLDLLCKEKLQTKARTLSTERSLMGGR